MDFTLIFYYILGTQTTFLATTLPEHHPIVLHNPYINFYFWFTFLLGCTTNLLGVVSTFGCLVNKKWLLGDVKFQAML